MDNLILIPARAGSTRVKGKNLRPLSGRPLLQYVIEAALASQAGRVVISTDSEEIAELAEKLGAEAPFRRPALLAGSHSTSLSCIIHALREIQRSAALPRVLAFCPPTCPMVEAESIRKCVDALCGQSTFNSAVTITKPKTHPFRIVRLDQGRRLQAGVITLDGESILTVERSQDWPEVFEGSPACRATKTEFFLRNFPLDVTDEQIAAYGGKTYDPSSCTGIEISPFEAIDVDSEEDFTVASALIQLRHDK